MTDREIIIRLATKVMGWEVFPLDREGYSDYMGPKLIENLDHNWIWFGAREASGRTGDVTRDWNPLTSLTDAMEVSEKCGRFDMIAVDKGWMVGDGSHGYTDDDGYVELLLRPFVVDAKLPRAICLTAVLSCVPAVPAGAPQYGINEAATDNRTKPDRT